MNYIYKSCPICGSEDIKVNSTRQIDGDIVNSYTCTSCLGTFSTVDKRKKALERKEKEERYKEELAEKRRLEIERKANEEKNQYADENKKLSAKEIFKKTRYSLVELYCDFDEKATTGTGIIISNKYILTNAHVVFDPEDKSGNTLCNSIAARFAETQELYEVEFVFADKVKDIALLMFERDDIRNGDYCPVELACRGIETGDTIYTLGNSKGQGIAIYQGIVSDDHREVKGLDYIMLTAIVTNGNSGGPVFNDLGQLIGMITLGEHQVVSMNYAIPLNTLIEFIKEVEEREEIQVL